MACFFYYLMLSFIGRFFIIRRKTIYLYRNYFLVSFTKPIVELVVRNALTDTEGINRNSFEFTLCLVEESEFFKITVAIHKSLGLIDDAKVF